MDFHMDDLEKRITDDRIIDILAPNILHETILGGAPTFSDPYRAGEVAGIPRSDSAEIIDDVDDAFPSIYMLVESLIDQDLEPVLACMDTGADVNIIAKDVVDKLAIERHIDDSQVYTFDSLAGGLQVQALGRVRLNVFVVKLGKWYNAWFYVMNNCDTTNTHDVLLSQSFVHQSRLMVHPWA